MRATLEKLDFPKDEIVVLADKVAKQEVRPTREKIAREINRLVQVTQANELLVIYLAGHSHRQDFVPCDAEPLDRVNQRLEGSISTDELTGWLDPLIARSAWLAIITDCADGPAFPAG